MSFTNTTYSGIFAFMSERSNRLLDAATDVAQLALPAIAGAFFAFSAGGHEVYAEKAPTVEIKHHEEQLRNKNAIPAVIFEGLVALKAITIVRRKPRTE